MAETIVRPTGPYRLRLMRPSGRWSSPLPDGRRAFAWQAPDGAIHIGATDERGLEQARFMLALDDDTAEFHRRFGQDPLIGTSARALVGYRPLRLATVAHATLRALCGQLIEGWRARAIERSILRAAGSESPNQEQLARFSPVELRRHGLAMSRATSLTRLMRAFDLERLRRLPTEAVVTRLTQERSFGPWSCGVVALEGLGRYDHGIVGDLSLMKLTSSLRGRWVEPWETAELLQPYGEWQGLAGQVLLAGWKRDLVPGADADRARAVRVRSRHAA